MHVRECALFFVALLWLVCLAATSFCNARRVEVSKVPAEVHMKLECLRRDEFRVRHRKPVSAKWKRKQAVWLLCTILLLSGDVHPNPGPGPGPAHVKYPCVVCSVPVTSVGIQCDSCDGWCHPECANIDEEEYERLGGCDDSWLRISI